MSKDKSIPVENKHPGKAGVKCLHPDVQGVHVNCNDCGDDGLTIRDYPVMKAS